MNKETGQIHFLKHRRDKVFDLLERRKAKYKRIGFAEVKVGSSFENTIRVGEERKIASAKVDRVKRKLSILNQVLNDYMTQEITKRYLDRMSLREKQLIQMRDYIADGYLSEDEIKKHQVEYEKLASLPDRNPAIKKGLDELVKQEQEKDIAHSRGIAETLQSGKGTGGRASIDYNEIAEIQKRRRWSGMRQLINWGKSKIRSHEEPLENRPKKSRGLGVMGGFLAAAGLALTIANYDSGDSSIDSSKLDNGKISDQNKHIPSTQKLDISRKPPAAITSESANKIKRPTEDSRTVETLQTLQKISHVRNDVEWLSNCTKKSDRNELALHNEKTESGTGIIFHMKPTAHVSSWEGEAIKNYLKIPEGLRKGHGLFTFWDKEDPKKHIVVRTSDGKLTLDRNNWNPVEVIVGSKTIEMPNAHIANVVLGDLSNFKRNSESTRHREALAMNVSAGLEFENPDGITKTIGLLASIHGKGDRVSTFEAPIPINIPGNKPIK